MRRSLRRLAGLVVLPGIASLMVAAPSFAGYNDGGYECSVPEKSFDWCYDTGANPHGYHNWEDGENQSQEDECDEYLYVGVVNADGDYFYTGTATEVWPPTTLKNGMPSDLYPDIGIITDGKCGGLDWGYFWDA